MTISRLYLDEDVDPLLARVLSDRGYDVLTTQDACQVSSSDADQLAFAAHAGRAILTHNAAHFALLARKYAQSGLEHHGIVLSDQLRSRSCWPGLSASSTSTPQRISGTSSYGFRHFAEPSQSNPFSVLDLQFAIWAPCSIFDFRFSILLP